jgi:hypothetical protein
MWFMILMAVGGFHGGQSRVSGVVKYWEGELVWINVPADSSSPGNKTVYKLYESPEQLVRLEAIAFQNRVGFGTPRDVLIMDYKKGTMTSFDKGEQTAVRFRLPNTDLQPFGPDSVSLGMLEILGFRCKGVQNTVRDPKSDRTEVREAWLAVQIGLKTPLLEMTRTYGPDGRLRHLSIKLVTSLKSVEHLESSLFQLPTGYVIR